MMRFLVCAMLICGQAALAAPDSSKRPVLRSGAVAAASQAAPAIPQPAAEETAERRGLGLSLRPLFRSRKAERDARKAQRLQKKGAICGDIALQGVPVGRVPGRINGCGVEDAVRVRSVSGVALSQQSVMDCGTARALKSWIDTSAKPALKRQGGGLVSLKVAAHYACRTRNSQKGAKISEHGKGRAIDISGFTLANGTTITVLEGWNARRTRKAMRQMHQGACGPFGTVLGPNADRFHQDHFHFDTARYRSGSYCR
jgi:hypothetical protein